MSQLPKHDFVWSSHYYSWGGLENKIHPYQQQPDLGTVAAVVAVLCSCKLFKAQLHLHTTQAYSEKGH